MKSKLLEMYDYKKIDLSEYQVEFEVDWKKIEDEMSRLVNRESQWIEGNEVFFGDLAVLKLSSEIKKYDK